MKNRYPYATLIFVCMFALLLPTLSSAEERPWKRPVVTFVMPAMGQAIQKNQGGLINDILHAVYEREGMRFRHEEMPYTRALTAVKKGEAGLTLAVGPKDDLLRSQLLLVYYDLSVAYVRGTPWEGVTSLEGQKVAFLHGFDLGQLIPVSFLPQQVYDLTSAFHMLDRDFATYILDDSLLLEDALFESKLPAHEFVISPIQSFEVRTVFAQTPQGRRYKEIFDRRYAEMIRNGELETILTRYGLLAQIGRIATANDL